jgi:hypothetical protein
MGIIASEERCLNHGGSWRTAWPRGVNFTVVFPSKILNSDYCSKSRLAITEHVVYGTIIHVYSCIVYQSIHAAYASLESTNEGAKCEQYRWYTKDVGITTISLGRLGGARLGDGGEPRP